MPGTCTFPSLVRSWSRYLAPFFSQPPLWDMAMFNPFWLLNHPVNSVPVRLAFLVKWGRIKLKLLPLPRTITNGLHLWLQWFHLQWKGIQFPLHVLRPLLTFQVRIPIIQDHDFVCCACHEWRLLRSYFPDTEIVTPAIRLKLSPRFSPLASIKASPIKALWRQVVVCTASRCPWILNQSTLSDLSSNR